MGVLHRDQGVCVERLLLSTFMELGRITLIILLDLGRCAFSIGGFCALVCPALPCALHSRAPRTLFRRLHALRGCFVPRVSRLDLALCIAARTRALTSLGEVLRPRKKPMKVPLRTCPVSTNRGFVRIHIAGESHELLIEHREFLIGGHQSNLPHLFAECGSFTSFFSFLVKTRAAGRRQRLVAFAWVCATTHESVECWRGEWLS